MIKDREAALALAFIDGREVEQHLIAGSGLVFEIGEG